MSAKLLAGTALAQKKLIACKKLLAALAVSGVTPTLGIVLVGDDPASVTYVGIKQKRAQEIGMGFVLRRLPGSATQKAVLGEIEALNRDPGIQGVIVQLPLPRQINTDIILNAIEREKDVDGLGRHSPYQPPTPTAILALLHHYGIALASKRVGIVGYGRLVGQPLAQRLQELGISHTVYTRERGNMLQCCMFDDVVIAATGEKVIFTRQIKPGAVVVDAAKDVDFDGVRAVAGALTPPSGGVGPLTVAALLENVVEAASRFARSKHSLSARSKPSHPTQRR